MMPFFFPHDRFRDKVWHKAFLQLLAFDTESSLTMHFPGLLILRNIYSTKVRPRLLALKNHSRFLLVWKPVLHYLAHQNQEVSSLDWRVLLKGKIHLSLALVIRKQKTNSAFIYSKLDQWKSLWLMKKVFKNMQTITKREKMCFATMSAS